MMSSSIVVLGFEASHVLTILAIGLEAPLHASATLLREPRQLGRVLLATGVVMPVLVALAIGNFDLTPAVKLALMALAVSPVPPIILHRKHAERYYPLALFMTTCALAPVLAPLIFGIAAWALDKSVGFSPLHLLPHVGLAIISPLLLGWCLRRLAPVTQRAAGPIAMLSNVLLVGSTIVIVVARWPSVMDLVGNGTLLSFALFTGIGLFVGHRLGGPGIERRSALALATGCRHPGIAVAIANAVFPDDPSARTAIVGYVVVSILCALPYVLWEHQKKLALSASTSTDTASAERAP
jgi:BASS family bile acid:Na+ symporter